MELEKISIINIPKLSTKGVTLQNNISLEWEQGQQWCVVGATGSGKTTLLKAIAGLLFVPNSNVRFPKLERYKSEMNSGKMVSDFISFVPQEVKIPSGYISDLYYQKRYYSTEQDDVPTVREILMNVPGYDDATIEDVLGVMSLSHLLDQPFVQLSNGQTRRLMIAIALLKQPKILILDNPYTGLDQPSRLSLNKHLMSLIKTGVHIMIAAHEYELHDMKFVTNVLRLNDIMQNTSADVLPSFYFDQSLVNKEIPPIELNNVVVSYSNKKVLEVDSLKVNPTDNWIIRGNNGSGKSTLLSLIVADHPQAYSNEVYLYGKRRGTGESIWDIKRNIGYFSSELLRYFSPRLVAFDVMMSGYNDIVGQVSQGTEELKGLVEYLSKWLGIQSLLSIRFGDLSFGQQKMILIARALIRNPKILILDEPLQGMDAEWREQFKIKIAQFSVNRAVLYVTHDDDDIPDGSWKLLNL